MVGEGIIKEFSLYGHINHYSTVIKFIKILILSLEQASNIHAFH